MLGSDWDNIKCSIYFSFDVNTFLFNTQRFKQHPLKIFAFSCIYTHPYIITIGGFDDDQCDYDKNESIDSIYYLNILNIENEWIKSNTTFIHPISSHKSIYCCETNKLHIIGGEDNNIHYIFDNWSNLFKTQIVNYIIIDID